jgi:hypothetical protein
MLGSDQNRDDELPLGGLDGADKRHGVDRMDDGGTDGPQTARLDDQLLVVTVCHGLSP